MAPEQVRGEAHLLDGRTDIYSLGVVLYRMLTAQLPFTGNLEELREQILQRPPRPLRAIDGTVPAELERICLKCLAKQAADRYPTAQDLAVDLRSWLEDQIPQDTRSVIEERPVDSLAALAAARDAGETLHAALLDTTHSAQFVLKEFELARQVVTPGGLILVHDVHPAFFDTWKTIDQIQSRGFGVVRLWCADEGVQTDDRLGLALIENRPQV
jgi:serine/threonine protein kinase